MIRCLAFLIAIPTLLIATTASSLAQLAVVVESTDFGQLTIYKMTVTPAAESLPAFKYRFTTPPHKTIPGNAITHYLRSFGEGGLTRARDNFVEEHGWEQWDGLRALDIDENKTDLEMLRKASNLFDGYVNDHIRRASRCRESDWGLNEEHFRGREAVEFLLPSIQQMRSISRVLALRTRLAIAEKRYEDAIDHIRMNYQLGQDITDMKILVTQLVGLACCWITNNGTLELIAAKDSPNLYWPLAELPRPLSNVRESLRLEMSMPIRYFPVLEKLLDDPNAKVDWKPELTNVLTGFLHLRSSISADNVPAGDSFGELTRKQAGNAFMLASGLVSYPNAKQRLTKYGFTEGDIEAMPVAKVMLLDCAFELQRVSDEYEKLAYSDAEDPYDDKSVQQAVLSLNLGAIIGDMILPAIQQVKMAEKRLTWQVNVLQNIEALRMHAATHGALPSSLDEIKLSLPNNPFTNQPYVYRLRGETAIIEMPFSDRVPGLAYRYEITLASEK